MSEWFLFKFNLGTIPRYTFAGAPLRRPVGWTVKWLNGQNKQETSPLSAGGLIKRAYRRSCLVILIKSTTVVWTLDHTTVNPHRAVNFSKLSECATVADNVIQTASWTNLRYAPLVLSTVRPNRNKRTMKTSSSAIAEKPRCSVGQFWVAITPYSADRPISINQIKSRS